MNPTADLIVVDVGNSRVKWGWVKAGQIAETAVLPVADANAWQNQVRTWQLSANPLWILSGSNPPALELLCHWLIQSGQCVRLIDEQSSLPIIINVDAPEQVGRDRLFNAMAVEHHPAIIISAGTAITVDAVSGEGHFLGGAIFPGLAMMAAALHQFTAKLPQVSMDRPVLKMPGKNTAAAIQIGISQAVLGGITRCCQQLFELLGHHTPVYLTGGDCSSLRGHLPFPSIEAPRLTLQGILKAGRALWP
jgi:type III pantothenate kinase